jgi:hypothetical protein
MDRLEIWPKWQKKSRGAAGHRWDELKKIADKLIRPRTGKQWLADTKQCLVDLARLEILQPYESARVCKIEFTKLAKSDQDRLPNIVAASDLYAFALAVDPAQPQQSLVERYLTLSSGARLRDGRLSLQVFVNDDSGLPIGMNIQLRGIDPARAGRTTYMRYDLDAVPMGETMGPVTHFNAHWHTGDDPDARDAEDHDPRLPALILDPIAVIEYLVEAFYPKGPDDLV